MYLYRKKYELQLDVGEGPKRDLKQTSFGSLLSRPKLYVPTSTKSISENPRLFILVFNLTNAHVTCNTH